MANNSIDVFRFTSLSRPPELVQQTFVTRSRPGVNGVTVQRMGIRARPFQVLSRADTPTLADAWYLYDRYRNLTDSNRAVRVTWAGFPLSMRDHYFFVLAVEPRVLRAIVRGHGGLSGVARAKIHCVWTLQPVMVHIDEDGEEEEE